MKTILLIICLIFLNISFSQTKKEQKVEDIINFSKTFLGTPYKWAGTTPSGFDCSGFISYIMGNFGIDLAHYSLSIAELGESVKISEVKPGDLMFFRGRSGQSIAHVALVIEVNEQVINIIHSSSSRGVVIDNFKGNKYFVPRYVKTKRLDYGEN